MNTADSFARDYDEARLKFIDAARAAGAVLESIAHPLKGPRGDALSTDVALLGDPRAERVLVMTSAFMGLKRSAARARRSTGCGAASSRDFTRPPPSC